jgi:H+/Cl- antiporter ClcA
MLKNLKFSLAIFLISTLTGISLAFFQLSLLYVTRLRKQEGDIFFYFLPLIAPTIIYFYDKIGAYLHKGTNLILEEIYLPSKKIPLVFVPLVFFSSLISHLFGASTGREGVGVQIGATIADQFESKNFDRKLLLKIGLSAGFGALFQTPLTGAIFGMEVATPLKVKIKDLIPCLLSSYIGYFSFQLLCTHKFNADKFIANQYSVGFYLISIFLGIYFGLVSRLFVWTHHQCKFMANRFKQKKYLYSTFIGIVLLSIYLFIGSDRHFGIGEEVIRMSFIDSVVYYDFLAKIVTTSLSLSGGFKGGEVMPLFYIGATAGNLLSEITHFPLSFFVPLGFVSLFSSGLRIPLSGMILAIELFGFEILPYACLTILVSYYVAGKSGIYTSQQ